MRTETTPIGAGESSPAPDGSARVLPAFCDATYTVNGRIVVCTRTAGHDGQHEGGELKYRSEFSWPNSAPCVNRTSDPAAFCHVCAKAENNRGALFELIHSLRGEHVCERCGRKFTVTFEPNTPEVK